MRAGKLYIVMLLTTVACFGQKTELPQTTLTLEPPFPEIFTGETVTLRCGVEGGSAGWKYLWYKDSEDTPVLQTAVRSITGDSCTITAAAVSDQGQYCCRGQRGDQPLYSQLSDKVILAVSEVCPKAVLTLQPAGAQIFTEETVTLRCEVEGGSAGWRFKQYRDGREEALCTDQYSGRNGDRCKITYAKESHGGVYWCESGQERSNAVTLTVSNEWVILQTPPQPVIEGDSLTLRCRVRTGYTTTRVTFYKDNKELQSQAGTELSVNRVSKSDEGSYKCRAWSSDYSAEVRVSVRELPQTTLTLEPPFPDIFTGETVTLRCGVEGGSAGWKYLWYKDSEDTPVPQTAGRSITGDSYTVTAAAVSDQGQYCCRGQRGDQPLYSHLSDKVILTVSDGQVILQTPSQPVFEGDSLTLRCRFRSYTATTVAFYKDNKELQFQAGTELSVNRVSKSDEGSYKCRAWSSSHYSAEVRVSVRDLKGQDCLQTSSI
ncbi:high affinity immunoglobulin gamma Fc receptor I-like [Acipenser ruthenus]|uniref:high affinity immunoglobulin gamma Fc receptor I-like n=1 Tax=Acipenser ruthenus TaxID=7906 RepID=UPI002740FF13|nr:high affinity immunoglobulin gamma Fc receptor I-like [Acipenser ruthenus]